MSLRRLVPRWRPATGIFGWPLRTAIFDAGVRAAALGCFASRLQIVGAFLARSGFKAEVVMDVVARRMGYRRLPRDAALIHDATIASIGTLAPHVRRYRYERVP